MNEFFKCADMKPTRQVSAMASAVRMVQYPDGRQQLQGAYSWVEGFTTGFFWKDMPMLMVDSHGQEFDND